VPNAISKTNAACEARKIIVKTILCILTFIDFNFLALGRFRMKIKYAIFFITLVTIDSNEL
jgi:hypothetical protein